MMDRQILPMYGGKVLFLHRDFPLAKHPCARPAAIAARFFAEKDPQLALEYRRQALASLDQTTPNNFKNRLSEFARAHGVSPADALAALENPRYAELVEKTPYVWVLGDDDVILPGGIAFGTEYLGKERNRYPHVNGYSYSENYLDEPRKGRGKSGVNEYTNARALCRLSLD